MVMRRIRLNIVLSVVIVAIGSIVSLWSCGYSSKGEDAQSEDTQSEDTQFEDTDAEYDYFKQIGLKAEDFSDDQLRMLIANSEEFLEKLQQKLDTGELNPEERHEAFLIRQNVKRKMAFIQEELDRRHKTDN